MFRRWPAEPKFSIKEQFLSSTGPKRAQRVVGGAKPLYSHPPLLSPADSSAQFEMGTQASPAPPVRPWNQVSVAQHTQTPLWAASQRESPDVQSVSCFPFCSRGWSVGCLPPPSRFMLPLYPHTTTTSMVSRLVSTTWSSGSLGGQDG